MLYSHGYQLITKFLPLEFWTPKIKKIFLLTFINVSSLEEFTWLDSIYYDSKHGLLSLLSLFSYTVIQNTASFYICGEN